MTNTRQEHDLLGHRNVPADALYGVHTDRALENFQLTGRRVHSELICAYGAVKLACARTNHELGKWDDTTFAAIERACLFLTREKSIPPGRILVLGQSVGSGPACWLAERYQTGGLILISPILSAFRSVTRIPLLPRDKFPNLRRISSIRTPLLVIHGQRDRVVPPHHGRRLHHLHPGPKHHLQIPHAGHNDLWHLALDQILHAIENFPPSPRTTPQQNHPTTTTNRSE